MAGWLGREAFGEKKYKEVHLQANLGWVDFDFGCSTLLPSCSARSANFTSAQAESGPINISQPKSTQPKDLPVFSIERRGERRIFLPLYYYYDQKLWQEIPRRNARSIAQPFAYKMDGRSRKRRGKGANSCETARGEKDIKSR